MTEPLLSSSLLFRILGTGLIAGAVGYALFLRSDQETGGQGASESPRQKYSPYFPGASLPAVLLVLFLISLFMYGFSSTISRGFSSFLGIFIHISLYYALLMCVLPFLRKHFTARACATLWMLPNILYLTLYSFMEVNTPALVLQLPTKVFYILMGIWFLGFVGVLSWQIGSHLHFRSRILRDSLPVTEPEILSLWQQEVTDMGIKKPKLKLLRSPHVSTPLSFGFSARSARVLLPRRDYTAQELSLIFRHELVHVCREDATTKFFLALCTAICWFNPLLWIAYRKSAEDIELGCDETVLLHEDEDTRRQYADLILSTAGDDRGFTTCLSASASSLRYRLKNIVKPRALHSGTLLCTLVCFLLCISFGYVAVAQGPETGKDILFEGNPAGYTLSSISLDTNLDCSDPQALMDYLSDLRLCPISGNFSFDEGQTMTIAYNAADNFLLLDLFDHYISVHRLHAEEPHRVYYVPEGVDFDTLTSLLTVIPRLDMSLTPMNQELSASLVSLQRTEDGITSDLDTYCLPQGDLPSTYEGEVLPETAQLSLSPSPVSGFTVEIQALDGSFRHTLSQDTLEDPWILPLEAVPAQYRICADFQGQAGSRYHGEFVFRIGQWEVS